MVLRVRELDARRASRAQGTTVVDDGVVSDNAGASGGARPGVEELRRADAVAEAVVDCHAQHHATAAKVCHLHPCPRLSVSRALQSAMPSLANNLLLQITDQFFLRKITDQIRDATFTSSETDHNPVEITRVVLDKINIWS
jgi:hypothetical protein